MGAGVYLQNLTRNRALFVFSLKLTIAALMGRRVLQSASKLHTFLLVPLLPLQPPAETAARLLAAPVGAVTWVNMRQTAEMSATGKADRAIASTAMVDDDKACLSGFLLATSVTNGLVISDLLMSLMK